MFGNFSIFHFLVYATCFGFVAAIIYTNIQRTALSKFIEHLIQNRKFDENSAVTLDEIGLNSLEKSVIKSAVKNQNGLKRCITVIKAENSGESKLEMALEGTDEDKYFITDNETEELLKKYSYKTLSGKFVILFIVALCAVVILATTAVDWLIKKITVPELEDTDKTEISETNDGPDISSNNPSTEENISVEKDDMQNDSKPENPYIEDNKNDTDDSAGPRIPVLK